MLTRIFKERAILNLRATAPPPFLGSYDSLFYISPVFALKGKAVSAGFKLMQRTPGPKILSCAFWLTSHFQIFDPYIPCVSNILGVSFYGLRALITTQTHNRRNSLQYSINALYIKAF
jgi:hypothetical protein